MLNNYLASMRSRKFAASARHLPELTSLRQRLFCFVQCRPL